MATTKPETSSAISAPIMDRLDLLFRSQGFAHFTVAELASNLGCSRRALYELAPSKPELLNSVIRHSYGQLLEDTRAAMQAQDGPLERFTAFFDVLRKRNEALSPTYLQDVQSDPGTNAVRQEQFGPMLSLLENNIRDGIDQGLFRQQNPAFATALAVGLLQAVDNPVLRERLNLSYAGLFDQALDLFRNGILA